MGSANEITMTGVYIQKELKNGFKNSYSCLEKVCLLF